MKRIYVLQYPDGTFWDGWEKHTDPLRTKWYDDWEKAEAENHECCGGIMRIRSLIIRTVEIEEVTKYD
jgi:hypothetical protein|nr:MAG TPA: hypothetical protein [Caudoviricetes sp.]